MLGNVALTLLTLLLLQVLMAGGWALSAWRLDLSRAAAAHWAAFALIGALVLAIALAAPGRAWSALAVGLANVLTVAALLSMRRGLLHFLRQPECDAEAVAVLALTAVASGLGHLLPDGQAGPLRVATVSLAVLWVLSRSVMQAWPALRMEFGDPTSFALLSPLMAGVALFGVRLGGALWMPQSTGQLLPSEGPFYVAVALMLLILCLLTHGSLAAVVLLRLLARLRHLSQRDALTGLYNRAEWLSQLDARHRLLGRYGEPYAVLLIDVDRFKAINDALGHSAGDAVLINVAQILNASARDVDVLGRLGGDEFCVLLPRADAVSARRAADRLRLAVADAHIAWRQHALTLTVSVGLSLAADPHETPQQQLDRADQALYQAKRDGRNRTTVARPAPA